MAHLVIWRTLPGGSLITSVDLPITKIYFILFYFTYILCIFYVYFILCQVRIAPRGHLGRQ
jgi:hypothetical protein